MTTGRPNHETVPGRATSVPGNKFPRRGNVLLWRAAVRRPHLTTVDDGAATVQRWCSSSRHPIYLRYMTVVTAVLAMFLVPKSVALAAPPEVNQRSCEEAGGTFARHHGTKTCTIVGDGRGTGSTLVSRVEGPYEQVGFVMAVRYVAERYRLTVITPVSTTSQKGSGPVTTTVTEETTEPEDVWCWVEQWAEGNLVGVEISPASECQARGLTP